MRTRNGQTKMHKGADYNLGSMEQDKGTPVKSTHDGVVSKVVGMKEDKDNDGGGNPIYVN